MSTRAGFTEVIWEALERRVGEKAARQRLDSFTDKRTLFARALLKERFDIQSGERRQKRCWSRRANAGLVSPELK